MFLEASLQIPSGKLGSSLIAMKVVGQPFLFNDFPANSQEESECWHFITYFQLDVLSSRQSHEENSMQVHEGECKKGDVLSLNILEGRASEELMRLLLTHGIEIEVASIQGDTVRLIIRAPAKMLIVEELIAPP